jgi:hypothetical protein
MVRHKDGGVGAAAVQLGSLSNYLVRAEDIGVGVAAVKPGVEDIGVGTAGVQTDALYISTKHSDDGALSTSMKRAVDDHVGDAGVQPCPLQLLKLR